MKTQKYIALILTEPKTADIYPLTRKYSAASLPIGHKKMIVYQLEQLQSIQNIQKIVLMYGPNSKKLIQDLQSNFLIEHLNYKHRNKLAYFEIDSKQPEYRSFQQYLNSQDYIKHVSGTGQPNEAIQSDFIEVTNNLALLYVPINTICNQNVYKSGVQYYEESKADMTLLLKSKKEYGQGQKIPEPDPQPNYDICMIGTNSQKILSMCTIDDYKYSGFQINQSIYKQTTSAQFSRFVDSSFYILGPKIVGIIKKLSTSEITSIKPDLIETIIRNQTNLTLLKLISQEKGLNINAKIFNSDEFIRRVLNLKLYEQLNFDAIIRGAKERKALLPTRFTQKMDEQLMIKNRTALIGSNSTIEKEGKIRRSCIGKDCTIGKNVEIENSIILDGTVIMEGSKIKQSTVGPKCVIQENTSLYQCSLAGNCKTKKNSKLEGQIILQ